MVNRKKFGSEAVHFVVQANAVCVFPPSPSVQHLQDQFNEGWGANTLTIRAAFHLAGRAYLTGHKN